MKLSAISNLGLLAGVFVICLLGHPFAHENGNTLIKSQSLNGVASDITRQTGIVFSIPQSLKEETLELPKNGKHWEYNLASLLNNFNTITLTGSEANPTRIIVLSKMDQNSSENSPASSQISNSHKYKKPFTPEDIRLNSFQLEQLAREDYKSPLSPKLLNDPTTREFLEFHGVRSPSDLEDKTKAIIIRVEARRQLNLIKNSLK